MVQRHPSTPDQRVQAASRMLAQQGVYGMVTQLSQDLQVSRQTLYTWRDRAQQALHHAFSPLPAAPATPLERQVLTLLVEGHNSYHDLQRALRALTSQTISLGTISAIAQEAQRRALAWMATHAPSSARPLALDEIYSANRTAYLHIVDTQSWAVWAAHGPLPAGDVDIETWTLVLWLAQERGLDWHATSSDGASAIVGACQVVDPQGQHGRDVWHVLHACAKSQGRLARQVTALEAKTATLVRQAARLTAGKPTMGPVRSVDMAAHQASLAQVRRTASHVAYLTHELRELLAAVVLDHRGVLGLAARQEELVTLQALLAEVGTHAVPTGQAEVERLGRQLKAALPGLLAFVPALERVEQAVVGVLGTTGLALVAWAWQRETILGPERETLLAGLPEAWRAAARVVMHTWDGAVRSSSAVENWHSILRPHLAVHRGLSGGMLALLAVWHNHRVFARGVRAGQSPLHLSGMSEAPTDWLIALGYPAEAAASLPPTPLAGMAMAA